MKTIFNSILGFLLLPALVLSSCGGTANTDQPQAEATGKTAVNTVALTADQYKQINIQLNSIEQKNLVDVLKVTGFLKVPPQNKASVTAALGGTVQSIFVQEGDHVQKGQAVATLTNPEYVRLQQEFLETKSQLTFAETEYNRQKELAAQNVAAQKTFQQAETNYFSLQAKHSSLRQQLSLLGINTAQLTHETIAATVSVRSPIAGSISHIDVNIGTNVQPAVPLMDVVDNSQLHLDLFVFEQDLPKVKVGQTVDFALTNLAGKNYAAKIFSIGSAFENETKTIPVHADITGEKTGLIEGMNVTALIDIGNVQSPVVPNTALTSSGGNDYIFVLGAGSEAGKSYRFERVQVKKGISDAGYTEVTPLTPLPESAKIVTNGAFYLMAMLTNTEEEE